MKSATKYKSYPTFTLPDRRWPDARITTPPIWCSVDLRDGNQALIDPMDGARKMRLWSVLVGMGFKEIEVGFPAASQTDYDFVRHLIEGGHIPDDVTIQVLTQAREDLIRRTFDAIAGARKVIVHLYNSTSEVQRRVVFGFDRQGCIDLALAGTRIVRQMSEQRPEGPVTFQYSPESYTGTEPDFAVEIVNAVADCWGATPERRMIVNLPATVEMSTPNVYADSIEWFARHVNNRAALILSVHPHNDRGTGVAAAEMAMMAGAERLEGTLFGNGERTGNVDVVTVALNMLTQGVDPGLDCADVPAIRAAAEACTDIPVHPRHPYAGDLVFTAFSGSHQDAIRKGLDARRKANAEDWEVPYLPIDPADVGRTYESVIRINSQSGKAGVAYIMQAEYGYELPRRLQVEFSRSVQAMADKLGRELTAAEIMARFQEDYLTEGALEMVDYTTVPTDSGRRCRATVRVDGAVREIEGHGSGPIDGFVHALSETLGITVQVRDYHEHAIGRGSDAQAAAYVEVEGPDGRVTCGAGISPNIVAASLRAVISAVNRLR